tara:strand:+ start:5057 stop:5482 length:426 start_codon:yes stop_codon:yes gene_type:complete
MNKLNTEYLFNTYPKIFIGKDKSIQESLMPFGFECDDGWFDLINELCRLIVFEMKYNSTSNVEVTQVKEKLGGLRFYYIGGDERIDGAVAFAERMSYIICEQCGRRGNFCSFNGSPYGWKKTLCVECGKDTNYLPVGDEED